jgi:hypothetical protein
MDSRGRLIAAGLGLVLALAVGAAFATRVFHLPVNCEGPSPNWNNPFAGNKPDMSAKTLLLAYEHPVYGRFWVQESVAEVKQTWIDSQTNNPTGCSEDSVVTLRNGTRASVMVGRLTSIMWLDQGLLIDVVGVSSKEHAVEVANQV